MNKMLNDLKIAIVVEELTQLGGAERVLDAFLEIFPNAPIFTIVWDKEKTQHRYDKFSIRATFIQKMPLGVKKYKWYLPLMPFALERLNFKEYDIIISITSALVKGIKTNKNQIHICYCNTPTRYLWTDSKEYVKSAPIPLFIRPFMPVVLYFLRRWDLKAAMRPNYYIANSKNVKDRIYKFYNRNSDVIYPNVDTIKFFNNNIPKRDYFLLVSRIEPYKKVEMVIDAFNELKQKLVIVGSGSYLEKIKARANDNISFYGRLSDQELIRKYNEAKAFIFPQIEDFGITPVEAMASKTPVIAFKAGGVLETVIPGVTGEFFFPQTKEALVEVVKNFDNRKYDPEKLMKQAKRFDNAIFKERIVEYIKDKLISKEESVKI